MMDTTRRQFLRYAGALSVGALASSVTLQRPASANEQSLRRATGVVFTRENGARRPLEKVLVSNGREVVRTDRDGRYELSVSDDAFVFVIKPSGWRTECDADGVPKYYYHHRPAGAPNEQLQYKGVAPTGALPESIDFELMPQEEPRRFRVMISADAQPYTGEQLEWYARDTVPDMIGEQAHFGLALGDNVGDNLDLLEPLKQANGVTGVPWYYVFGNHDLNFLSLDDRNSRCTFERIFGPSWYAFEYSDVHFIVLNTVRWNGFMGWATDGRPIRNNYAGHLSGPQLEFVKNYLAHVPESRRVVVCSHIPLISVLSGPRHEVPQSTELFTMLARYRWSNSFSGHTHMNDHLFAGPDEGFARDDGELHHHWIVGTSSGSWYRGPDDEVGIPFATMRDGIPNGYGIAEFEGTDYRVRFQASRRPSDYRMLIHGPDSFNPERDLSATIVANVFDGNEKCEVRMRVKGQGEWQRMRQAPQRDPAYLRLHAFDRANPVPNRVRLLGARSASHMWAANLPADLKPGHHLVEVEAVDMFGEKMKGHKLVWVR